MSAWSDPPHAGQVYIYFLMEGGRLPTPDECAQVYAVCNADRIRPLTDQVFVQPPALKVFGGQIKYWIRTADDQFSNEIQTKVTDAFNDYKIWQTSAIGRDINPSKADQMIVEPEPNGSNAQRDHRFGCLQHGGDGAKPDRCRGGTSTFSLGAALTNGYVVAGVVVNDPTATVTAMTFDGVAMVAIDSNVSGGRQTALFGQAVGNKAAGTYNVGWTVTGTPSNIDFLVFNFVPTTASTRRPRSVRQAMASAPRKLFPSQSSAPPVTWSSAWRTVTERLFADWARQNGGGKTHSERRSPQSIRTNRAGPRRPRTAIPTTTETPA